MLGIDYEVSSVAIAEDLDGPLAHDPPALATALAVDKAVAAARGAAPGDLVLTCDTLVMHDGRVLGKPSSLDDARRMLGQLSGREHRVVTACAILAPGTDRPVTETVVTKVRMNRLAPSDIEAWISEGEVLGCAGAYNIERHLATVEPTECHQNVAGLPLCHLYRVLVSGEIEGVPPGLVSPVASCEEARGVECPLGRSLAADA
jgi:septum formation protein